MAFSFLPRLAPLSAEWPPSRPLVLPRCLPFLAPHRLWSVSEVEEKLGKHSVVPQLRLRGSKGQEVVARDVLIFRLDNLEGELMGQAILFREWEQV